MVKFKSLDRCSTTSSYSTSLILCKWHHQARRLDIKKGALGAWVQPVASDSFWQPWNVWNQAQTLSVLSKPCWPTVSLITVFPVLMACVHSHPHSRTSPSFHLLWSQLQPKAIPDLIIQLMLTVPEFVRLPIYIQRASVWWPKDSHLQGVRVADFL